MLGMIWFTLPHGFFVEWWYDQYFYQKRAYTVTQPVVPQT